MRNTMTENICRYSGDRDQAIVSYLYGDDGGFDAAERAAFDAHVAMCEQCRAELIAFEDVRMSLGQWSPPEFPSIGLPRRSSTNSPSGGGWREIPAWAQVAAAMLCLGVGAAIANLNVRYDANGLQVRTGWSTAVSSPVAQVIQPVAGAAPGNAGNIVAAPWRAELTALEQRLRADMRGNGNLSTAANPANAINRALVDESARRQQTELALRLAEAVREVNAQRQADLVRIDRSIGAMQNNTGREMLRQRNEMLNYVSLRTASQRPQ
jgi:putative zinc finger protein